MRTIKPPPEWQVTCERCSAVLAYNDRDVGWEKFLQHSYVICPHCENVVTVPDDQERREYVSDGA